MASPEIFRVIFKEHGIELTPKPVNIEVFQAVFLFLVDQGNQIAEAHLHGGEKTEIFQGFQLQGNGVIIKFRIKINTGYPVPCKHNPVFLFRVRAALGKRHGSAQDNVIVGRCALHGKHFIPPLIYFRNFGKETVTAHIHAVAFIVYGFGDTAEAVAFFKNDDLYVL